MTQAQLDFHNMTSQITQEQIDLQNQLEMHTTDLITKPFSNGSPGHVLFLDNKETPDNTLTDQMEHQNIPSKNKHNQMEHRNIPSKNKTPSDHDQCPETPPSTKKKYEIMKDTAFLSSPIYPPIIPTKPQLSTTRDDNMAPYHYLLDNGIKIFSLQFNFLRPSIYDLKTDENDPSFLSTAQKTTHHLTYTRFFQHNKPQNYIFANCK